MTVLSPLGWIYGKVMEARNWLYDRRVFRSYPLGAKTISVGNITTGGTGKTPLVAMVSEILHGHGEKVCILTRGYGRENAGKRILVSDARSVLADPLSGGDEPVELARKLLGKAVVLADRDRVAGSNWARKKFGVTAFVLDDAFQHRKARRDVDIVCIDATRPLEDEDILPAGTLREPLANLNRADAIVITRADLVDTIDAIAASINKYNQRARLFSGMNRIVGISSLDDFLSGVTSGSSSDALDKSFAFCALANSANFFDQLRNKSFGLAGVRAFRDHHRYAQGDLADMELEAKAAGAENFITTAKDAVKLSGLSFKIPCFVALIRVEIDDPEAFRQLIISS